MAHPQDITDRIVELAAMPGHKVPVAEAALTIAQYEYPTLDVSKYLGILDELGDTLKPRIAGLTDETEIIHEINRWLFAEEGYRGNTANYYDPRNSFLNQVIDRKLGIPITLSIVYIEVGRRAGLPLYGIGLPGHFITGLLSDAGRIFIDPFNGGEILSEDSCRRIVLRHRSAPAGFKPHFLDPVWPKQILVRMLRNLKATYWRQGAEIKALQMIEWVTILAPDSPAEYRERGFINEGLGDTQRAADDLERYLDLLPDADDREMIKAAIERLRARKTDLH